MITKGSRNETLYNRASDLKKDGATYEQIELTIRYMNQNMMHPPVSEGHVKNLLRTVAKWFKKEVSHVD